MGITSACWRKRSKIAVAAGTVAQQLSPIFDRAIGSQESRAVLVATHDDFQQTLGGFGREVFHSKIVDAQEVWLEEAIQGAFGLSGRLVGLQIADQIEHRAIEGDEASLDRRVTDGLSQTTFPDPGWPEQEDVPVLADEVGSGQLIDLGAFDRRIEVPVELIQGLELAKGGRLFSPFDPAMGAHV